MANFLLRALIAMTACLGWAKSGGGAAPAPPAWQSELSGEIVGSLDAGSLPSAGGTRGLTASLLGRKAIAKDWYWAGGVQAETFYFDRSFPGPKRLQDLAANVALEYYRGDEQAAELSLQPGWYFSRRPTARAFDLPFIAVTGVPFTTTISGVIGLSNARFYHHPLPILGVVGPLGPHWRLEMVYPEPALIYSPSADRSWRLRGELIGAGFLDETRAGRAAVEYASYQVGVEFRRVWPRGGEIAVSAGVEAIRSFDYFHQHDHRHGGGAPFLKVKLKGAR